MIVYQCFLFMCQPGKKRVLSTRFSITSGAARRSMISTNSSDGMPSLRREAVSNAPYHFLLSFRRQTALSGNLSHRYSSSSLYFFTGMGNERNGLLCFEDRRFITAIGNILQDICHSRSDLADKCADCVCFVKTVLLACGNFRQCSELLHRTKQNAIPRKRRISISR